MLSTYTEAVYPEIPHPPHHLPPSPIRKPVISTVNITKVLDTKVFFMFLQVCIMTSNSNIKGCSSLKTLLKQQKGIYLLC